MLVSVPHSQGVRDVGNHKATLCKSEAREELLSIHAENVAVGDSCAEMCLAAEVVDVHGMLTHRCQE